MNIMVKKWKLKFKKSKCNVLCFGQADTKPYKMLNIDIDQMQKLKFVNKEKDLVVILKLT